MLLRQKVLWKEIISVFCYVQSSAQPWRVLLARWHEAVLMLQSWQYSGQESSLQHASFLSPTDVLIEAMCTRAMQLAQLRCSAIWHQLSADMFNPRIINLRRTECGHCSPSHEQLCMVIKLLQSDCLCCPRTGHLEIVPFHLCSGLSYIMWDKRSCNNYCERTLEPVAYFLVTRA